MRCGKALVRGALAQGEATEFKEGRPMIDHIRRNILATGAAAAAVAAAPQVFAQAAGTGPYKVYEKGNVRIRYVDTGGSGFPLARR